MRELAGASVDGEKVIGTDRRRFVAGCAQMATPAGLIFLSAAITLVVVANRHGVGITPDSVQYLAAASHLREGQGLSVPDFAAGAGIRPLYSFAPLYPIMLAALPAIVWAIVGAASLIGLSVWYTRRDGVPAAVAVTSAALAIGMSSGAFVFAISESMSLPLLYLTAIAAISYRESGTRGRTLFVSAALSLLVRYANLFLIPALVVICWPRLRRRVFPVMLLCCMPLGLWMLRNQLLGDPILGRSDGGGPLTVRQLSIIARILATGAGIWVWRREPRSRVSVLLAITYALFLGSAILLHGRAIPMDARMLAPIGLLFLLSIAPAFVRWRGLALGVALGSTAISGVVALRGWRNGFGYRSTAWRTSPTLDAVRVLPSASISSNGADLIFSSTHATSAWSTPGSEYLVKFDGLAWRSASARADSLARSGEYTLIAAYSDGRIYRRVP